MPEINSAYSNQKSPARYQVEVSVDRILRFRVTMNVPNSQPTRWRVELLFPGQNRKVRQIVQHQNLRVELRFTNAQQVLIGAKQHKVLA